MKERISMVIFVLILGSILTTALVAVDYYTTPRIERNKAFKTKTRVLEALGIPCTVDNVEEEFSGNVKVREIEGKSFYLSQDGSVAFEIAGSGLWGPISGVLALAPDLKTIKGLTIIHQEETPGLGGTLAEDDYLDKFRGKKILPRLTIQPPGEAKRDNEVDGITGATMSSKAFEKIINSEAKANIALFKGNR